LIVNAISPVATVDQVADLDLGGNVVKAINFTGSTGTNKTIGGVTFLASNKGATVDGVTNNAGGTVGPGGDQSTWAPGPSTGDADLNALFSTANYYFGTTGEIDVALAVNGLYNVQLLLYDGWAQQDRQATFTIEGDSFLHDYMDAQGAVPGGTEYGNGAVLNHTVMVADGVLDIDIEQKQGGAAPIGGLVVTLIPEPSTLTLFILSLLGLLACGRRRRR